MQRALGRRGRLCAATAKRKTGRYDLTRRKLWKWLSAASIIVCFAVVAAGCGGGGGSSSSTTTAASGGSSSGKSFANFRIAYDTGIDFLDPGLSYTVQGWAIMWNVYLPLLGYKHVNGPDGATLVPYLAADMPKVSADGLTYTITLRKNLKYSDGTPVKASDFGATIERDYKIDSPGVGFFGNIVGTDTIAKTKKGHISGITADDAKGTITIKLKSPQGDFEYILATEFAAPVPASSPAKDSSTAPLPSTGPYVIQSYKPNKSVVVVRNPNFDAANFGGNVPAGNPDKMTISIFGDPGIALTRTLQGQEDYDFYQPPNDRLAELQNKYASQIKIYTPANTFYYFMNNRVAPFDNLKVRQAVNYAINREALVRIYGGLATPTENVLPPTYPQYKKLDLYPYNLAKAKQLIKSAGATGASVTVWTSNNTSRHAPEAGQYLQGVLKSIGLNAKLKEINAAVYWTTVGSQSTKAQIGFADWFQDYPHPLDWFDVLLNGNRITDTHNNNYANFDDSAVNTKIEALKKEPTLTSSINAQWAGVDEAVMKQAAWAPYLNQQGIDTFNSDIDLSCYVFHVNYQFDFATICHK
ncbi:MAG: peptide/nickel transport system substrate-binding protein [Gaiellales bacterium]|nr:peptide/nickel transport system substrate-binding protein [Gaiellales bacterium]